MRKQLFFFSLSMFILSCNRSPDKSAPDNEVAVDSISKTSPAVENNNPGLLFSEAAQRFVASSEKTTEITGKKGLKITVDPTALETGNGSPLGKQIEVNIKEITNQQDLFRNDAPTVSNGKLLISGGSYDIEMTSNGNNLRIKANRSLKIQIPKISDREMELFYGQRDSLGSLNWLAAGKKIIVQKIIPVVEKQKVVQQERPAIITVPEKKEPVTTETDLDRLMNFAGKKGNRISVREFDSLANFKRVDAETEDFSMKVIEKVDTLTGKKTTEIQTTYYTPIEYYLPVEVRSLGWINCDRFSNYPNKSEIRCEFDSSVEVSSAKIYVVFKSMNAMQQEFISAASKSGSTRLNNQYPAGQAVQLLAFARIGKKYYASKQDLVLKSQENVKLKFSPVADIEAIKLSYTY
ncbi:MAG TPA: hypothetical protein VK622_12830 [Puia sp.]|nr:hypothetical protein [Puia sp.]